MDGATVAIGGPAVARVSDGSAMWSVLVGGSKWHHEYGGGGGILWGAEARHGADEVAGVVGDRAEQALGA
jgi:hypothetical protein